MLTLLSIATPCPLGPPSRTLRSCQRATRRLYSVSLSLATPHSLSRHCNSSSG